MLILARLFAALAALHVPPQPCAPADTVSAVAREYPECVDEYGADGLSGLDAEELRERCEEW